MYQADIYPVLGYTDMLRVIIFSCPVFFLMQFLWEGTQGYVQVIF